jgi:hypothetical protein
MDFPSAILHAEEPSLFETAQIDCRVRQFIYWFFV